MATSSDEAATEGGGVVLKSGHLHKQGELIVLMLSGVTTLLYFPAFVRDGMPATDLHKVNYSMQYT